MSASRRGLRGHPKGVVGLSLINLWYIAAYAGLIGHVVLLLTARPEESGYGWTSGEAVRFYGLLVGLIHVGPLIGGWISDALTGRKRAAVLGAACGTASILLLSSVGSIPAAVGWIVDAPVQQVLLDAEVSLGRWSLAPAEATRLEQALEAAAVDAASRAAVHRAYLVVTLAFWLGVALFAVSYALIMPSLYALFGLLYADAPEKREAGYTLFFMVGNAGFIVGGVISGMVLARMGWDAALVVNGLMAAVSLVSLLRTRANFDGQEPPATKDRVDTHVPSLALDRSERRRVLAIAALSTCYLFFVLAFEQWGGSFSLYVENYTDRSVSGFEVPTLWIHSAQSLFVIMLGPIMISFWARADRRGWVASAPAKMVIGMLITALAFLCMAAAVALRGDDPAARTAILWPLAYYWIATLGQLSIVPIGYAAVYTQAPKRLLGSMMGMWMLFAGIGAWLSGQVGGLAEPFGFLAVYLGIAAGSAVVAAILYLAKSFLLGLLHEPIGATERGSRIA